MTTIFIDNIVSNLDTLPTSSTVDLKLSLHLDYPLTRVNNLWHFSRKRSDVTGTCKLTQVGN